MKSFTVLFAIILNISICFAGSEVVFIGLYGEGAPAVEKTYDRLLREHLSVLPQIHSADYVQSQRYSNMIKFDTYPTVSENLVKSLITLASDTTLFVWGTVKEYRIKPIRKAFFFSKLKGELTIGLNMYSLSRGEYAYCGNVKAVAFKSKGMVGFRPVEKITHISALDRAEILEKLEYDAVEASGRMISAVVRSESSQTDKDEAGVDSYKVPSMSDVFSVPSVDGQAVENVQGKQPEQGTETKALPEEQPDSGAVDNTTSAVQQTPDTTAGEPK